MRGEELHRLVDVHRQHLAHGLAAQAHLQRLGVEARAAAALAGHAHVGQEGHLDLLHALALAGLAAPARGVEREAARAPAAHARLGGVGEQLADVVPEADVGRGTRARRLADRRLVDLQHALDRFTPLDGFAAHWTLLDQAVEQDVPRQGGLAGARHPGDRDQPAERNAHADVRQVVQAGLLDLEAVLRNAAARLQRVS